MLESSSSHLLAARQVSSEAQLMIESEQVGLIEQLLRLLQASEIEDAFVQLHTTALDVTNLLAYVSLNMAAVRKILKKAAKKLPTQTTYGPGAAMKYAASSFS